MGLNFVEKDKAPNTPASGEKQTCCHCGRKLKTRKNRIRLKDQNFICGNCYQHLVNPETCHPGIEMVD